MYTGNTITVNSLLDNTLVSTQCVLQHGHDGHAHRHDVWLASFVIKLN